MGSELWVQGSEDASRANVTLKLLWNFGHVRSRNLIVELSLNSEVGGRIHS